MPPMRTATAQARVDQQASRFARFALPLVERQRIGGAEPRLTLRVYVFRIDTCCVVNRPCLNFFKLIRLPADVDDLTDRHVAALQESDRLFVRRLIRAESTRDCWQNTRCLHR